MKLDEAIVNNFDAAALAELAVGLGIALAEPDTGRAARAVALVETVAAAGRAADLLDALAAARPGVPWTELPYPAATLRRLHAALCRRHSLDSLRTLAFRLGLDFDELPGDTKSARARELVLAMDRHGRAAELVARYPRRAAGRPTEDRLTLRPALRRAGSRLLARSPGWLPARPLARFVLLLLALGLLAAGHRPQRHSPPADSLGEWRPQAVLVDRPAPLPVSTSTPTPSPEPTATPAGIRHTAPAPVATPRDDQIPRQWPTAAPVVLVGERGANLRRGPGPEYDVVATLRAGARLELRAVSPTGEWYQVRLPGQGTPWVDARYATVIGGADGAPVATGELAPGLPGDTLPPVPGHSPATATPAPSRPATMPPATPPGLPTPPRPTARPSATPPAPTIPAPTAPPP